MILVTGASGFIGLNLAEAILGRGQDMVAFDVIPFPEAAAQEFDTLPGTLHCYHGDVRDIEQWNGLFRAYPISAIIHAATLTYGGERGCGAKDRQPGWRYLRRPELVPPAPSHEVITGVSDGTPAASR